MYIYTKIYNTNTIQIQNEYNTKTIQIHTNAYDTNTIQITYTYNTNTIQILYSTVQYNENKTKQNKPNQTKPRRNKTKQNKTKETEARQRRTGQDKTRQDKTRLYKTVQNSKNITNRTKQYNTKLPCVLGGQGRWTRSVTNLTRYMSPWQFWPKWEMARLHTFKRLGAHAHRELKSPRDLQKARGGRCDPRASYPKPCHRQERENYPPPSPSSSHGVAVTETAQAGQCGSVAKTLAEVMVQECLTTCQAAACHADSGAQIAEKLGSANIGLQSVCARGEEAETEKVMTEAARKRIDESWDGHYHISFPPTWVRANSTLGAVKRQLETRAAAIMEVHKVKCLVEREAKTDTIVLKLKPAAGTLRQEKLTEEQQVASIWEFLYKHCTLMLAYAMAAAPEWASADLSLLLEYHEFVISKALETDRGKGLSCEASSKPTMRPEADGCCTCVRIVTEVCQTQ